MKGLAQGIEKSRGMVEKAIGKVSADLVVKPEMGAMMNINRTGGSQAESSEVVINVPLYLDGKQITSATSTIQSGHNSSYKRAMGVI